jgi:AraC family transcriptional regulator of adaptative response / DNA-3-methyladenine glycosylase II
MPRARGRALVQLCEALAGGEIALDRSADRSEVRELLLALPGIGPWTADYVAMRALGHPDVFLPTDLAVRRLLAERAGSAGAVPDPETWRPWRSYALMHLWNTLMPDTPAPPRPAKEN